jgi:hypothetical protein
MWSRRYGDRMRKKGYAMNLLDTWVDICALVLLVLGFFMTLVAGSKVLSVLIVGLSGMLVGRSIYMHKHKLQMRFWYVISGFIIGLVVGSRYLTYKGVLVTFVIGAFIGHYLRKKKVFD